MNVRNLVPWRRTNTLTSPQHIDEPSPFWALQRQIDRVFDDFVRGFSGPLAPRNGWSAEWPEIDVSETEREVRIRAELPGMEEKGINVTLSDGLLTLSGEKKLENKSSVYSEFWHGQFTRSIPVGSEIDPDKVEASFKNGVLTITMAKRPEAQSNVKRIAIN